MTGTRAWALSIALGALIAGCGTATPASCVHASDCTRGTTCIDGTCTAEVTCATSRSCPGLVCDLARGVCAECVTGADCFDGAACIAGVCEAPLTCASDRDCSSAALVCDAPSGRCVECNGDLDCTGGDRCRADHTCGAAIDAGMPIDASPSRDAGHDAGAISDVGPHDAGHDAASVDVGHPDTSGPDAAPGPCDPSTSADLFAWYVGDRGVAALPAAFTWADQSSRHNDLGGMGTLGGGPTVATGAANGHDAINFSTGPLTASCDTCPSWLASWPFVVAVVYRIDAPGAGTMWGRGVSPPMPASLFVSTHSTDFAYDVTFGTSDAVLSPPTMPGRWEVMTAYADGHGGFSVAVNTHPAITRNDPLLTMLSPTGAISLGAFQGAIAEVVMLAAPPIVPRTDPRCVTEYLMGRYGIVP